MAPELFTYKVFEITEGERELLGIVIAADMGEALQKAASLLARHHTASSVELERTARLHGGDLGHLSRPVGSRMKRLSLLRLFFLLNLACWIGLFLFARSIKHASPSLAAHAPDRLDSHSLAR